MRFNLIRTALSHGFPLILVGTAVYVTVRILRRKKQETKPTRLQEILWFVFALYILTLLSVTVVPSWRFMPDENGNTRLYVFTSMEKPHVNLVPFRSIRQFLTGDDSRVDDFREAGVFNCIGNALLYLPFGLLGIIAFGDTKKTIRKILLAGLLLCLLIETLQYFVGRSPDVDDVILNMAGLAIGVAIGILGKRCFRKKTVNK